MNTNLAFDMEHQKQTNWCWAAVAVSIGNFYTPGAFTQCALVNNALGQTTCCMDGGSAVCNVPWYLDRALQLIGHLRTWTASAASFNDCDTEIMAKHPLGVRIQWAGDGGHFVAITGVGDNTNQLVTVQDPWYGTSHMAHDQFATNYRGLGQWTHNYFTQ